MQNTATNVMAMERLAFNANGKAFQHYHENTTGGRDFEWAFILIQFHGGCVL
tara:strand:+ start:591 stop:746 length:156 start_codon:yes stop_codon:yes gene_type:complete